MLLSSPPVAVDTFGWPARSVSVVTFEGPLFSIASGRTTRCLDVSCRVLLHAVLGTVALRDATLVRRTRIGRAREEIRRQVLEGVLVRAGRRSVLAARLPGNATLFVRAFVCGARKVGVAVRIVDEVTQARTGGFLPILTTRLLKTSASVCQSFWSGL